MKTILSLLGLDSEPTREIYEPYRYSMTPEFVLSYPVEKINERNLNVMMRAIGSLDDKDEAMRLRLAEVIKEIDRRLKLKEYFEIYEIKKDFRRKFFIFAFFASLVIAALLMIK